MMIAMDIFHQYRRYSIAKLYYYWRGGKTNPAITAMGGERGKGEKDWVQVCVRACARVRA